MTDDIDNGGAGEEAPGGDLIESGPASGDEEVGETFRVTYYTAEGDETTHLRILDVEGDSMEPEIREGDWVGLDLANRKPAAGGTFLLLDGERPAARQVEAVRGDGAQEDERLRLRLIPADPDHAPSLAEDVQVRDKVLWVVRRVVRTGRRRRPPG